MTAFNPQGCTVTSFKAPSAEELRHDYLWRIHQNVPRARRDRRLQPLALRGRAGGARERARAARGVESRATSRSTNSNGCCAPTACASSSSSCTSARTSRSKRFEARMRDPAKRWKFDPADLAKREQWDDYRQAFEAALGRCSTEWAPWYLIPADRKWLRNLAVSQILVQELGSLPLRFPEAELRSCEDSSDLARGKARRLPKAMARERPALLTDAGTIRPTAQLLATREPHRQPARAPNRRPARQPRAASGYNSVDTLRRLARGDEDRRHRRDDHADAARAGADRDRQQSGSLPSRHLRRSACSRNSRSCGGDREAAATRSSAAATATSRRRMAIQAVRTFPECRTPHRDDVCLLAFTSGTTGQPKRLHAFSSRRAGDGRRRRPPLC